MKILFLSQRFLFPLDTGGKIRTAKLLEQLKDQASVTLLSNVDPRVDGPYLEHVDRLCARFIPVERSMATKTGVRYYLRACLQSARSLPISVLNDYSHTLRRELEAELRREDYDLAVCDFVQSAGLFRNVHDTPTLLLQHNTESVILKRHMQQARSPIAMLFWWQQWRKMFRYERAQCRRFDTVVAVSETDAVQHRNLYNLTTVSTISTGVDVDYDAALPESATVRGRLVFYGSMDWWPNHDAMLFFIQQILPIVRKSDANVSLLIVGRNPKPRMRRLAATTPGVTLTDFVEDIRPHVATAQVIVVPIRVGSGTRIKIYEGMAMSRAMVTTSIGAEGLDLHPGRDVVVADEPKAFAQAVIDLLQNEDRRRDSATRGRDRVVRAFSWQRSAREFLTICRDTVARQAGREPPDSQKH